MKRVIDGVTDFGKINSKLKEVMVSKNISINDMSKIANIKYDVVKRYYYNNVYQVDLQIIAKFCYVLNCNIHDIFYYECSEELNKQKVDMLF